MNGKWLGVWMLLAGCFGGVSAAPYIGYVYPAAMQIGTTNTLIVCGQGLRALKDVCVGPDVACLGIEPVPGFAPPPRDQRKYLVAWLDAIAAGNRARPPLPDVPHLDEWRSNHWWRVLGDLGPLELSLVEHWLYTPRNPLQMSPALSQRALVRVAVSPAAQPGVREFRVYGANGFSAPRPFLLTASPHVAEPRYAPRHRPSSPPPCIDTFPCFVDGQIEPGQTDRFTFDLKAGQTVTFRVFAREFVPYIGDAVPGFFNPELRLLNPAGKEAAVAMDYYYHPDPVLVFTPTTNGVHTLEIRDTLYRGRMDFVYSIAVQEGDVPPPVFDVPLTPLPDFALPPGVQIARFRGTVRRPHQVVRHEFEIPEPGEYVFDLLARRLGSPLDGRVSICDAARPVVLAQFNDTTNTPLLCGSIIQTESDPIGRYRFAAAGRYVALVEDEIGVGGDAHTYTLRIYRPTPRFEVWARTSSFGPRRGKWQTFKVEAVRHDGFVGDIHLEADPCVRLGRRLIPAASNVVVTSIQSRAPAGGPIPFGIRAWAKIDGAKMVVPVVPADVYNQAFAWDHLLPARSFMLMSEGRPDK